MFIFMAQLEKIIFDHDFAKAFWKDEKFNPEILEHPWQEHLARMVLLENPLDYIKQFL